MSRINKYYVMTNSDDIAYQTDDYKLASTINKEYLEDMDVPIQDDGEYLIMNFDDDVVGSGIAQC